MFEIAIAYAMCMCLRRYFLTIFANNEQFYDDGLEVQALISIMSPIESSYSFLTFIRIFLIFFC